MRKTLLFFIVFGCFVTVAPVLQAQTADQLQSKIEAQNIAISALEREIAGYQSQLTNLSKQKDTLANALAILNLESKKISADIRITEGKIKSTNLKLDSLGASISKAGSTIEDLKQALAKSIREINTADQVTLSEILISKDGLSDIWHYQAQQDSFHKSIKSRVATLTSTKTALVANKTEVEKTKKQLLAFQAQLKDQQTINQRTQAQQKSLLSETKNQESNYQKIVASRLALKTQLENDLRDFESQLTYVNNPGALPKAGSQPFSWPVDLVRITQLFGKTVAAARLYTSGSHNGVDFGIPTGTPVRALADGVVLGSGNADLSCKGASYGIWIFIKYDNGLSAVFGHLSLVRAQTGARVNRGEVVAYSGATGYATGPHLHVSVFPNDAAQIATFKSKSCPGRSITIPTAAINAYLDPMLYFPK